jgi:hypothetical protein
MARTAIAVQQVQKNKSGALTFAAADQANGMSFPNDGNTILRVKNAERQPDHGDGGLGGVQSRPHVGHRASGGGDDGRRADRPAGRSALQPGRGVAW